MTEVKLVDREEYTSRTTGTVEQGETIDVPVDLAGHLVRNRGFAPVEDGDGQDDEHEHEHEHETEDEN